MMPEEPNKAEELLKRYAQERRAQGGEFSLHPATRRVLQGEVARTLAKQPEKKRTGWSVWFGSWTGRLAFATGAAAIILTGILVVWNEKQEQRTMELARATIPEREGKSAGASVQQERASAEKQLALVDAQRDDSPAPPNAAAPRVAEIALKKEAWFDDGAGRLAFNGPATAASTNVNLYASYFAYEIPAQTKLADQYAVSLSPVANAWAMDDQKIAAADRWGANRLGDLGSVSRPPFMEGASAARGFDQALGYGLISSNAPGLDTAATVSFAGVAITSPPALLSFSPGGETTVVDLSAALKSQAAPQVVTRSRTEESESRFRYVAPGAVRATAPVPLPSAPAPSTATGGKANESLDRRELGRAGGLAANEPVSTTLGTAVAGVRFYRADGRAAIAEEAKTDPGQLAEREISAVLSSFVIEQTGSVVRVVDADGSIYEGSVEMPLVTADFDADGLRLLEKDALAREELTSPRAQTALRHEELSFRVAGSNVTLRQNVVVSARLLSVTNAAMIAGRGGARPDGATPPEDSAKLKADTAARRAPAPPERGFGRRYSFITNHAAAIEGTVRIGGTNQQWFRAVPQPR